jgi:hypothetical protein
MLAIYVMGLIMGLTLMIAVLIAIIFYINKRQAKVLRFLGFRD